MIMLLYLPALIIYMTDILYFVYAAIALSHISYQLFFIRGLAKIKPPDENNQQHEGVSVLIAARNEEKNLRLLVPHLFNQEYPLFEIIIVINNTSDGTHDFLIGQQKIFSRLRIVILDFIPEHINSKKYAITLGIRAASYNKILLTDADCLPVSKLWIKKMMAGYGIDTDFVLGFSPYRTKSGLLNKLIRFETCVTAIQYLASASNGVPYMGVGRNLSYQKSFFLSKNGFNGFQKIIGGDDDLFVNKNATSENTSVILDPDSIVISEPESTFGGYFLQKIRHLSVGRHYKSRNKIFLGLYALIHLLFWAGSISGLVFNLNHVVIILIFTAGYIPFIAGFHMLNKKSGSYFPLTLVIFIDLIFIFFYIIVGSRSLFTRKIEWTS